MNSPVKPVPPLGLCFDDTLLFDADRFAGWERIDTGQRNSGNPYTFRLCTDADAVRNGVEKDKGERGNGREEHSK
ncbi:MAG: hypothetical protein ACKVP7_20515 [Hyphomicrobiaceae bacterium]